jgi:hypothetical protein
MYPSGWSQWENGPFLGHWNFPFLISSTSSIDHLRAQALSAQKAKDGKIFWVEFAPQFHTHLVKCAVALVPHPIQKVKKVMFGYILELLNGEGPQAFFDLAKGTKIATQAQKEKKRLARKRTCASRRERRKAAEEAAQGAPQRQCKLCRRKFASRKSMKRHWCPLAKEVSRKAGTETDKGKTKAPPKPSKPAPTKPPAPPKPHLTPHLAVVLAVAAAPLPSDTREKALAVASIAASSIAAELPPQTPGTRRSKWLNTLKKRTFQREIVDSTRDRT